ncbi:MAG: DUF2203 domain-containing protein [Gemmataceae bacterium]|nr:DUF2203 domain-containing protein [Gemmataceae bacterium]
MSKKKKLYSVAEANATLPLVRTIVRDITVLAADLRERFDRITAMQNAGKPDRARQEELQALIDNFERDQDKLQGFVDELQDLKIELKDLFIGLIDFRARRGGREVYLCWKLGEPEVAHWHELDAGFADRQKLETLVSSDS